MSDSSRIQPPSIIRYFNNICFKNYWNLKCTFLFKSRFSFQKILLEVTTFLQKKHFWSFLILLSLTFIGALFFLSFFAGLALLELEPSWVMRWIEYRVMALLTCELMQIKQFLQELKFCETQQTINNYDNQTWKYNLYAPAWRRVLE